MLIIKLRGDFFNEEYLIDGFKNEYKISNYLNHGKIKCLDPFFYDMIVQLYGKLDDELLIKAYFD